MLSFFKSWVVVGIIVAAINAIVLADSDPGYSQYYRSYDTHKLGYNGYGTISKYQAPRKPYQDPSYRTIGEAYRSLPMRRDKNYAHPYSAYGRYKNPAYYNRYSKHLRGGAKSHFGYPAKPSGYPHAIGIPKPHPVPHPEPHPIPHPQPHPVPHPTPHPSRPVPHPHPTPLPHPQPHPVPHPTPHPPRPVPHPHPTPLPHPVPSPHPHPNPHPHPHPHPAPLPQPNPVPAPTPLPVPQPTPHPIPEELPDVVVEENIPIPHPVDPAPIPEVAIPITPIETIGRPPVAPSIKPPGFVELQRAVPGFVDIKRVTIHPHGHPTFIQPDAVPEVQRNIFQFPIRNTIPLDDPEIIDTAPEPIQAVVPQFPIANVIATTPRTRIIKPLPEIEQPTLPTVPVESVRNIPFGDRIVPSIQHIQEAQPPNLQPIPLQNNVEVPTLVNAVPALQAVPERQRPVFQSFPAQSAINIPLLAKAVPAVPDSNPQPRFKTIAPDTAQATALLLQASLADFGREPSSGSGETPGSTQLLPVQRINGGAPQFDFSQLPAVILPDPVPAVPLTQP